jgi:hypothetical protein
MFRQLGAQGADGLSAGGIRQHCWQHCKRIGMERVLPLPPAFRRFRAMGGVLDFAVFKDADGTEDEILSAVPQALYTASTYDREKLRSLGSQRITEQTFFGDWYDYERGLLLKGGCWTTTDGRKLKSPPLVTLVGLDIGSGGGEMPAGPGQFAFAFLDPPYGLYAKPQPDEVQAVFEEIRDFMLPPKQHCEIADWSNERLAEVSDYFEPGMEWWGVFLFSIHVPSLRRLTIVVGSATD